MRDVPFYLPSFGEAEAILNLLEHLQSTMLLEISISNLHYSVNVLASLIARLVNDHYTARRKFAYSVWRAHQSTMQIVELQKRRARIEQSYAFSPDKVRVHYVTYGSNMRNDGLQWLLKSASLAGVRLQVLGQGEIYIGLGSKVSAYHSYIMSPALLEEDVAVLVDGYDVLFFPSVRRLLSIMRRITDKPIVICAEGGIYPELMSPYFYHHQPSSGSARSKLSPHFVSAL
ncbi:hypothetical protein EON65_37370 [archaeon]|nr:MAG: hypothetical protein EON65_37370 [archaeon]